MVLRRPLVTSVVKKWSKNQTDLIAMTDISFGSKFDTEFKNHGFETTTGHVRGHVRGQKAVRRKMIRVTYQQTPNLIFIAKIIISDQSVVTFKVEERSKPLKRFYFRLTDQLTPFEYVVENPQNEQCLGFIYSR